MLARQDHPDAADGSQFLQVRYERIKALPLEPVPNDAFPQATTAWKQDILGPAPAGSRQQPWVSPPAGLPPYLASLYQMPLLTRDQEVHLFRKMNYLKYQASLRMAQLDPERLSRRLLDQIEQLYRQSIEVKNEIIRANLRLVVAMCKRYARHSEPLFELVSDGNISLLRAVERFDFALGFRFSTYASWAIIKNFTQSIWREHRDHGRFPNAGEAVFEALPDRRTNQWAEEAAQVCREGQVARLLEQLDDRERQIIRYRYGIASGREPMTLRAVGDVMGVTKERIRQLAKRALAKLQQAAVAQGWDVPEDLAEPIARKTRCRGLSSLTTWKLGLCR